MALPARDPVGLQTKTASFTASPAVDYYNVDTTAGAVTVTLPAASTLGVINQPSPIPQGSMKLVNVWTFMRTTATANAVTITPASGTINGGANLSLAAQWNWAIVWTDGANFFAADG